MLVAAPAGFVGWFVVVYALVGGAYELGGPAVRRSIDHGSGLLFVLYGITTVAGIVIFALVFRLLFRRGAVGGEGTEPTSKATRSTNDFFLSLLLTTPVAGVAGYFGGAAVFIALSGAFVLLVDLGHGHEGYGAIIYFGLFFVIAIISGIVFFLLTLALVFPRVRSRLSRRTGPARRERTVAAAAVCPYCGAMTESPSGALTVSCSGCHRLYSPEPVRQEEGRPHRAVPAHPGDASSPESRGPPATRRP
jgi:heme/copper-type cytochrome/quinol oxidase subunit 2